MEFYREQMFRPRQFLRQRVAVGVASDAESTGSDQGLDEAFMHTVADLAQGELTFPAPFDLASAAALRVNADDGELAERLFEATASRDCGYEVTIRVLTPEGSDPEQREIIDTTVSSTPLLIELLTGLLDELEARAEAEHTAD
jgi:hypothetical protein